MFITNTIQYLDSPCWLHSSSVLFWVNMYRCSFLSMVSLILTTSLWGILFKDPLSYVLIHKSFHHLQYELGDTNGSVVLCTRVRHSTTSGKEKHCFYSPGSRNVTEGYAYPEHVPECVSQDFWSHLEESRKYHVSTCFKNLDLVYYQFYLGHCDDLPGQAPPVLPGCPEPWTDSRRALGASVIVSGNAGKCAPQQK